MEPCDAVLCAHSLLEYTDVIIMMDNGFVFVSLYMGTPAVRSSKALSRAAVGPANDRGHLGRGGTGTDESKETTAFQFQVVCNAISLAQASEMVTVAFLILRSFAVQGQASECCDYFWFGHIHRRHCHPMGQYDFVFTRESHRC